MTTMQAEDLFVNRAERYSVGIERESGRFYVSIPVANRSVDYEEFYEVSASEHREFMDDPAAAASFANRCRQRQEDSRLMIEPGADRGVAV